MIPDTPEAVLALSLRVASLGVALSSLELWFAREALQEYGLMSWEIGSLRAAYLCTGWLGKVWDGLLRWRVYRWQIPARFLLSLAMVFLPAGVLLHPAVLWPAWLMGFLFTRRNHYGLDGADQMQMTILLAGALASLHRTPLTLGMALGMISLQCSLAYCIAGTAKMGAKGWRDGTFLPGILGTDLYGMARVGRWLGDQPWMARLLSWSVMLWEMLFPLAFALPWPWGLPFVVLGVAFHAGNAIFMGLGSFLIAFTACYPAIVYCLKHKGW